MRFKVIEDDRDTYGPYRMTTLGYQYIVEQDDGQEVIVYHWHPRGNSHRQDPHIHVGQAQLADDAVISRHSHLTSGRVTFESVIRMTITEWDVQPLVDDWDDRLVAAESPHLLFRSWHYWEQPGPPSV